MDTPTSFPRVVFEWWQSLVPEPKGLRFLTWESGTVGLAICLAAAKGAPARTWTTVARMDLPACFRLVREAIEDLHGTITYADLERDWMDLGMKLISMGLRDVLHTEPGIFLHKEGGQETCQTCGIYREEIRKAIAHLCREPLPGARKPA